MRLFRCVWAVSFLCMLGCVTPPPSNIATPQQIAQQLKAAGGWRMLPFPDSKYEPGSILVVSEEEGIRWMSHLGTGCGVPAALLMLTESVHPSITLDREAQFSSDWLATYADELSAGPEFEKIGFVGVTLGESSAPAIDALRVWDWLKEAQAGGALPPSCAEVLARPDSYVVNESFRVTNARFRLLDKRRREINVSGGNLARFLRFGTTLRAEVTSTGEIVISRPVYIAVRGIRRSGSGIGLASGRSNARAEAEQVFDSIIARYPRR